jgi:hypothetical protein
VLRGPAGGAGSAAGACRLLYSCRGAGGGAGRQLAPLCLLPPAVGCLLACVFPFAMFCLYTCSFALGGSNTVAFPGSLQNLLQTELLSAGRKARTK